MGRANERNEKGNLISSVHDDLTSFLSISSSLSKKDRSKESICVYQSLKRNEHMGPELIRRLDLGFRLFLEDGGFYDC